MHDPDDQAWTAAAARIDDFTCDILFRIETRIAFCDPVTGHVIPGAVASLPEPDVPFAKPGWALASALIGREDALVAHYRRVVDAYARQPDARLRDGSSACFWLQPAIVSQGEVLTEFTWYDDVGEAEAVLTALVGAAPVATTGAAAGAAAADGVVLDDLDQGWRIRILAAEGAVYLAEWDWEDKAAVVAGYAFDAAAMAHRAGAALERLGVLHRHLVGALGRDYWTYRGGLDGGRTRAFE